MFVDIILTNHLILNDRPNCEIALVCVQSAYRVGADDKLEQFAEIHTFRAKFSRKALLEMAAVVKVAIDNFPKECQCGRVATTRNCYGEDACEGCEKLEAAKEEPPCCVVCGKLAVWGLDKCKNCLPKPKECSGDPANAQIAAGNWTCIDVLALLDEVERLNDVDAKLNKIELLASELQKIRSAVIEGVKAAEFKSAPSTLKYCIERMKAATKDAPHGRLHHPPPRPLLRLRPHLHLRGHRHAAPRNHSPNPCLPRMRHPARAWCLQLSPSTCHPMSLFKRQNGIWHYCIRMADGQRHMRTAGTRDKAKARAIYDRARAEAADILAGRLKSNHAAIRKAECAPLAASLDAYEAALCKSGRSPAHIRQTRSKIERTAAATEPPALRAADLCLDHIEEIHKQLHAEGRSRCTMNGYQTACKSFLNWLVDHKRLETNPIRSKKRMKTSDDRRRQRRALSPEELRQLIQATRQADTILRRLNGQTRAALYELAAGTGLRANEIRSLPRAAFRLDAGSVTIRAQKSKNRREAILPMSDDLVATLRASGLAKAENSRRFFASAKRTADMIRRDIATARAAWIASANPEHRAEREASDFLKPTNTCGEVVDFHAMRHTFVDILRRAGVEVQTAQKLARHSDPRLTLNIYSHSTNPEQRAAVNAASRLTHQEVQP